MRIQLTSINICWAQAQNGARSRGYKDEYNTPSAYSLVRELAFRQLTKDVTMALWPDSVAGAILFLATLIFEKRSSKRLTWGPRSIFKIRLFIVWVIWWDPYFNSLIYCLCHHKLLCIQGWFYYIYLGEVGIKSYIITEASSF